MEEWTTLQLKKLPGFLNYVCLIIITYSVFFHAKNVTSNGKFLGWCGLLHLIGQVLTFCILAVKNRVLFAFWNSPPLYCS